MTNMDMSKLKDPFQFYDEAYALQHCMRYSMVPSIKQESVAEHSFFVALGVMLLSEKYNFDKGLAIQIALAHDLPEIYVDDINHHIKKMFPKVAEALKEAEASAADGFPDSVKDYVTMYHDKSVESLIVHYADAWQCLIKANNEIKMGNHGYFDDVKKNSIIRLELLTQKLETYVKR